MQEAGFLTMRLKYIQPLSMSLDTRKPVSDISAQFIHKPGCADTNLCYIKPSNVGNNRGDYQTLDAQADEEPRHEKTNILVSDQVRHKPGCTATEDGKRLEISDLGRRGIVLSM